ncbi:lysylphosphatidylglycerol synthase domain-containing protein [Puniceicoccaceae bacterium K14]|nr:lysylphosphatidylglycerol synthase domain-containing protein [Puniceicoccaceae bacterium K14]
MRGRRLVKFFSVLISFLLLGLAIRGLAAADWSEAFRYALEIEGQSLVFAVVFIVFSFLVYAAYDVLALAWLGKRLSYVKILKVSFLSTCVSMNVGIAALSGSAMRMVLYPRYGLSVKEISYLYVKMAFFFITGWATIGGIFCLWLSKYDGELLGGASVPLSIIGWSSVIFTAAYLFWVWKYGEIRLGKRVLELPSIKLAVYNIFVAGIDIATSIAVFHVLVPGNSIVGSAIRFMAGNVIAILSQVPGGIGVFEWMALELTENGGEEHALGGLLVFRMLFFWVPMIVALGLWACIRINDRKRCNG